MCDWLIHVVVSAVNVTFVFLKGVVVLLSHPLCFQWCQSQRSVLDANPHLLHCLNVCEQAFRNPADLTQSVKFSAGCQCEVTLEVVPSLEFAPMVLE